MAKDILLYETGNGGDIKITKNDIELCDWILQIVYICLFGGNVEKSTKGNELINEVRFDWWANSLLFSEDKEKQFNSETEKTLNEVSLNSAGRITIKRAVEKDLEQLKNIANFFVEISLSQVNRVEIIIRATQPLQTQDTTFSFIWDTINNSIITINQL